MTTKGSMHIIYQCLGAASVGVSGLVASIAMGYTAPALPSMKADEDFSINEDDESWIGSVMPASALVGSLAAGPLLDTFGRRTTFMFLALPFMISWAIIAVAGGVEGVILGRMLSGACVGVQAVAGSVLMPEMVQMDLRNVLFAFPAVLRNLGKRSSSLAALKKLRQSTAEAEKEQKEIDASCASASDKNQKKGGLMEILEPPNLWPVSVGAALMVAQQTTGLNAVLFYASSIFEAGGDFLDASTSTTLLGLVNFFGVFLGLYFVANYKRRQLVIMSTVALCLCLSVLSAFFWAQELGGQYLAISQKLSFIPVLALLSYMAGFPFGWGPVPWVYLGEGIPSSVRGKAAAFVVAISWGSAFLVTKTFKWSISLLGIHYVFLGYAIATVISGILIHRSMPETHKMSSVQMEKLYRKAYKMKEN